MSKKAASGTNLEAKETSSPVPMGAEWTATIKKLLGSKEYDRAAMQDDRISVDKLPKDDLLVLLSGMPFEFRRPAYYLHRIGYMIIGKVPFRPGKFSPDGEIIEQPTTTGEPRPVSCPEPPGDMERFVIAWKEGILWNWRLPTPENGESDPIGKNSGYLKHFEKMLVVRNPYNEELKVEDENEFLEDFFQASHSTICDISDSKDGRTNLYSYDLDDFETLMHQVNTHSQQDDGESNLAFYAGFLCARELFFPQCAELHSKSEINSFGGWGSIIYHALMRHGIKTSRKKLLMKLGCLNSESYRKGSHEPLKFSWLYPPEINGVKFDDFYKKARLDLKRLTPPGRTRTWTIVSRLKDKRAKLERNRNARSNRKKASDTNAKLVALAKRKKEEAELTKKFK